MTEEVQFFMFPGLSIPTESSEADYECRNELNALEGIIIPEHQKGIEEWQK